eukprot:7136138-Prymnesium_polylepis.1
MRAALTLIQDWPPGLLLLRQGSSRGTHWPGPRTPGQTSAYDLKGSCKSSSARNMQTSFSFITWTSAKIANAATLRNAADQDDAQAQYCLGVMYAQGRGGLPKDDAQVVPLYRQAAVQGFAPAQFNLGVMYEQGRAVPPVGGPGLRTSADQPRRDVRAGTRRAAQGRCSGGGALPPSGGPGFHIGTGQPRRD